MLVLDALFDPFRQISSNVEIIGTSGPPLETDIVRAGRHVSKVPKPTIPEV
jgi:hypothetical protein